LALTDKSDLYGAIHEVGLNLLARHIMRQRPSLFNYGTELFVNNPYKMCERITVTTSSDVYRRGNPLVTREDPLPILGTGNTYGLDYCVQIVEATLDFHPGNTITLPAELGSKLQPQKIAIRGTVCTGLGCPPKGVVGSLSTPPWPHPTPERGEPRPRTPPAPIPWEELTCVCIQLVAVAHVEPVDTDSGLRLLIRIDRLEVVDIKPEPLESMLECYISVLLELVILPRVNIALAKLVLELMTALPGIELSLPITASIPNNPAIEDDQLKVFINAEALP
jgi:hypothetical protein